MLSLLTQDTRQAAKYLITARAIARQRGLIEEAQKIDYRFNAVDYIRDVLGYTLWRGTEEMPGQIEVVEAYQLALLQQYEQRSYERGETQLADLKYWQPEQIIQNHLKLSGGHSLGKTLLMALLVRHFFDCFLPSVAYTFAPTFPQLESLLWKEIGVITSRVDLPMGRLMAKCEIKDLPNHFVKGRAVPDTDDTETIQGQHEAHQLYVVDEAEGVGKAFWKSREALISGGISIVLMSGNPATRSSNFHRIAADPRCRTFILSGLAHPNVIQDRDIVPSAIRRDFVETMLRDHCDIVNQHDQDQLTFEVPWNPNTIYLPGSEFLFRVMGLAPTQSADKSLVPIGRYEAACKRTPQPDNPTFASLGVDVAWYGLDSGTIYTRHNGAVYRAAVLNKQEPSVYWDQVRRECLRLTSIGVRYIQVRLDAGGGFASGIIEMLKKDHDLKSRFVKFEVFGVNFGATGRAVHAPDKYHDVITELTADAAESLKGLAIIKAPQKLEQDLCDREYEMVNDKGKYVKKLQEKKIFKKKHGYSPDDGDGFVLAVAAPFLFKEHEWSIVPFNR